MAKKKTNGKSRAIRIGVDIGGTFTDLALEVDNRLHTAKTLTTSDAPERGVLTGVRQVLAESGVAASDVTILIYGTTLATNAIIERKGSTTALITTDGFRDTLEMRNENRYEQYDLNIDLPTPLVPRYLRLPVKERIDTHGKVLLPLQDTEIEALIPTLVREGVESVAVGFLHSYTNPSHEKRAAEILERRMPGLSISLSSEVSPEMREYERFSTACANAYVRPIMSRHLTNLERDLRAEGITCPLFLMLSGGGITTLMTAARFPVRLVESGPAGGAIFSSHLAGQCGLGKVLSYDMGGTTAKICLIEHGLPQTSRTFEVARVYRFLKGSGLPLRIPVIEMVEIGAGGGSIAHIDNLNRIAVGPESAGADPGPASYDLGGDRATVTDADVVMGKIDPDNFAGGSMRLNVRSAESSIVRDVGEPLGLATPHAALGVCEIVDENMANAARVHAIERGKSIETRTLVAFGGAAPLHATRIADKLAIDSILVPVGAGVGSAIGFLRAPVSYEVVHSHHQRLGEIDVAMTNRLIKQMRKEAHEVVEPGAPGQKLVEIRHTYMRYVGQGHEVAVAITIDRFGHDAGEVLRRAFEREYSALYDRLIPGLEVEILSWSLLLSTVPLRPRRRRAAPRAYTPKAIGKRPVLDSATGRYRTVPIYERVALKAGARIRGPAIIIEQDTATHISDSFDAMVNAFGYIVMTRHSRSKGAQ